MARRRRAANKGGESGSHDQALSRSRFPAIRPSPEPQTPSPGHGRSRREAPAPARAACVCPVPSSGWSRPAPLDRLANSMLGQARATAKVAHRRQRRGFRRALRKCSRRSEWQRWGERKLLPVPQFDDPSVRFQPQALHVPPDFRARPGCKTESFLLIARRNSRRCALRLD